MKNQETKARKIILSDRFLPPHKAINIPRNLPKLEKRRSSLKIDYIQHKPIKKQIPIEEDN